MDVLTALWITLGIQAAFFTIATTFKTDKVTDLSYGLTFVILALLDLDSSIFKALLVAVVILWGLRLAGYLFIRIIAMGKDKRFDGIRENFWSFAKFWSLQGIAIWVISLPFLLAKGQILTPLTLVGITIALAGLLIESVADMQKFIFKQNNPKKLCTTGLWKYARHPNYFGELLFWWALFIAALPGLQGLKLIAVIGPIFLTVLLLKVSGIPTLEKQHQKYGKEYENYKKRTRMLIPLPK